MTGLLAALALAGPSWTLVQGGDLMLNGIPVKRQPLSQVASLFREADVAIANLEIPLTDTNERTSRKSAQEIKRRDQYVLKADPSHVAHLGDIGLDLVSLGNNHAMDYGPAGLRQMTRILDRQKIGHTGAGHAEAAYRLAVTKTPAGLRVGLLSALAFMSPGALLKCSPANPKGPGVAVLSFGGQVGPKALKKLESWVGRSRKHCDMLVVAVHWGIERQTQPTPYQVSLGRALVDAGADVVWGHHPHVLQGAELYRGKPIFYSMGNLVSPMPGVSAVGRLTFEGTNLSKVDWVPVGLRGGRTSPLNEAAAAREIARMRGLGKALLKRYPSKHASELALGAPSPSRKPEP